MLERTAAPHTKPTSFIDAKLLDASESEIVIQHQGERIVLDAIHGNLDRDKIGKIGVAQCTGEGGSYGFVAHNQ